MRRITAPSIAIIAWACVLATPAIAQDGLPDLTVSFTGWDYHTTYTCPYDPPTAPVLCVSNIGSGAAGMFSVDQMFYGGTTSELMRYDGLAAGARDCGYAPIPGDVGNVTVMVDSRREVDESDESNNTFSGPSGGAGTPIATCTGTLPTRTPTPTATPNAASSPQTQCIGDCDLDDTVTVDELIIGIDIALGVESAPSCPSFSTVGEAPPSVDRLLVAVNNALEGCHPVVVPPPPPTATRTETPGPAALWDTVLTEAICEKYPFSRCFSVVCEVSAGHVIFASVSTAETSAEALAAFEAQAHPPIADFHGLPDSRWSVTPGDYGVGSNSFHLWVAGRYLIRIKGFNDTTFFIANPYDFSETIYRQALAAGLLAPPS